MTVTVFLKVTYHENVGEDRLYVTMSVDLSITLTSVSLHNFEHRSQVKSKGLPVPPVGTMHRPEHSYCVTSYCSTF